jgi:Xaa-Pro dipeptidase
VMIITGFKAMGPSAAVLDAGGGVSLVVTPAWDAERARKACQGVNVVAADDVIGGLAACIGPRRTGGLAIGLAGLGAVPWGIARPLIDLLPTALAADAVVDGPATVKTELEIAYAREAARIAELIYRHLLDIARPGVTEDELAVELRWHGKKLGAEDNFLLLCAAPHNRAVAPSNGRRLQAGDILLAEITPSFRGQLAQICRTVAIGGANAVLTAKYRLVVDAMTAGIRAAQPGVPMAAVCEAIDAVLEAEGYGAFCKPPYIRRRGHGLGFGSIAPGDVSRDNAVALAPGMVFMIHPNQYLPETGYLLCGEPVVMTRNGAEPLTRQHAQLAEIAV